MRLMPDTIVAAADLLEGDVTTTEWLTALAIFIGGLVAAAILRRVVLRVLRRGAASSVVPVDETAASLVARIAQAVLASFTTVYALYALGVQVGPLLAALGIGGVAIAFAMRDTLENLIAGLVLQLRRPFVIGDSVTLGSSEGTVVDIGFRYVQLSRPDGTVALLPARRVLDDVVVNHSGGHPRRTALRIALAPGTDVTAARAAVQDAVAAAPSVLPTPAPAVLLAGSDTGAVELLVRVWHDPASSTGDATTDEVLELVHAALSSADAQRRSDGADDHGS